MEEGLKRKAEDIKLGGGQQESEQGVGNGYDKKRLYICIQFSIHFKKLNLSLILNVPVEL